MDEGASDQLDNNSSMQIKSEPSSSSSPPPLTPPQHISQQQQQQQQLLLQQPASIDPSQPQQQQPSLDTNNTQQQQQKLIDSRLDKNCEEPQEKAKTSSTSSGSSSSNSNNDEHLPKRNPTEDLFSTKRWGITPIRQDTPWELPPSPTQTNSSSSSSTTAVVAPGPTLPPGISQSGDSFRSSAAVGDFNAPAMANNFAVDNMGANSLSHMNLGNQGVLHSSRFDQPWRAPAAKPHQQSSMAPSSPFANHNLMNAAPSGMQKSMLNSGGNGSGGNGNGNGGSSFVGMQQGGEFARAPGPASSIMDNNMTPKPFGMANRSSTWSAFGTPAPNEPEPEWPKTNASGISVGNPSQPSNAFDLVPEFEPGKSWHGSMLMKGLVDDSSMNSGSAGMSAFASSYAGSSKSPTGSQYEPSGIGTWSPIVKGGRPGSKWDGDGPDNGRGDNGRFDDGTAIWGSSVQNKIAGVDWVDKSGDANSINDKSRSIAGNNQSYRPQQSSSSTSLLMSSNTGPSNQHNRNQQSLKQPSLSHNFDQVQQQSNALSSQANQPNRGLGLSSNVPSTQQLKHMVQQIQLAVQAGHLNPQILNQPLSPVTLQLLYQLLQQIKTLQQLQLQASQQFNKSGNHPAAVNVHITKTKQNILNLQNQIHAQQAVFLKQTQAHNISSRQPAMPNLATGGVGGGIGPALPPGISQSGDSFRSGAAVGDFHAPSMVNNYAVDSMSANGLANSLSHMNLGNQGVLHSSRFDQPWRAPAAKPHQQSSMAPSSPFANHNLMNAAPSGMQKSMLNSGGNGSGGNGNGNGGSSFVGMQQGGEFARAPGPASSIMDNNMTPKPFGMANRSSTWSAFGTPAPNEPEPEWPKTTTSGISAGNSNQTNAFDLVPEFEPGKPWRGSMLMKSVEDDPTMTPGSMARSLAPQRKTIWSDEIL